MCPEIDGKSNVEGTELLDGLGGVPMFGFLGEAGAARSLPMSSMLSRILYSEQVGECFWVTLKEVRLSITLDASRGTTYGLFSVTFVDESRLLSNCISVEVGNDVSGRALRGLVLVKLAVGSYSGSRFPRSGIGMRHMACP